VIQQTIFYDHSFTFSYKRSLFHTSLIASLLSIHLLLATYLRVPVYIKLHKEFFMQCTKSIF